MISKVMVSLQFIHEKYKQFKYKYNGFETLTFTVHLYLSITLKKIPKLNFTTM